MHQWRKGGAEIRKAVGHLPVYDVEKILDFYDETYRRHGKNYVVHCPWHPDTNPSFRIDHETGLSFCDPCGEGTTLEGFLVERGHEEVREILNDYQTGWAEQNGHRRKPDGLEPWTPEPGDKSPSPDEEEYEYVDEDGEPVLKVKRYLDEDGRKKFKQYRWTSSGWKVGLGNVERVIYNLPEVLEAVEAGEPVYIVEGEKDADALMNAGVTATTFSGGAGKMRHTNIVGIFDGADVVIVADREYRTAGIRHAIDVKQYLGDKPASVKIVGAAAGKDAADHLYNGCTVHEFVEWEDNSESGAETSLSDAPRSKLRTLPPLPLVDYRDISVERDEWLIPGVIAKGELSVLGGAGGMAKTTTTCNWVAHLSQKGSRILVLAERSPKQWRKRLTAAGADFENVRTFDLRQFTDVRNDIDVIERAMDEWGVDLLVLDPINHFMPAKTEGNQDMSVRAGLNKLLTLCAERGLSVLGLHHLNKDDQGDPINRLTGSAVYRDLPYNIVGMGVYPTDTDQRALVLIKTNADDGVLQGALIYELETVELEIDGEQFKVAKSNKVGADGTIDMHDVFTKKKRQSGQDGKTTRAKEALLEDGWMPTNPDDSQDSDWIAVKLRELSGVSLHPKNVAKLMPELYEEGFVNFVPAKKGPGGHKDRWYLTL